MALHVVWSSHGGDAFVGFDIVADEAVAVVYENLTSHAWEFQYVWHGQPDLFTLDPGTNETSIGIPPGQRKWIAVTLPDGEEGFDTDLDAFSVQGIDP